MTNIYELLENDIYFINSNITKTVDTVNGLEDKVITDTIRKNFLKESVEYLYDDLVFEKKKHYPENNKLKKEFSVDAVVMKKDSLLKLIKHIENIETKITDNELQ